MTVAKKAETVDALCHRCGARWRRLPSDKAATAVLNEHFKFCPVPIALDEIVTAIQNGAYDQALETLLTAAHNRKRFLRGDTFAAVVGRERTS